MKLGSKIALWVISVTVLAVVTYLLYVHANRATPEQFDQAYRAIKKSGSDVYDMSDDLDDFGKAQKLTEIRELFSKNLTKDEAEEYISLIGKTRSDKLAEARWIELFKKSIVGFVKMDGTVQK